MAYIEQPRRRFGLRSRKKPPSGRLARITFVKNPQTANSMEQDLQQPAKAPVFLSIRYPGKDWVSLNGSRDPTAEELAKLASQGKPLEILFADPVTQQKKMYKIVRRTDLKEIEATVAQQNEQDPPASASILAYANNLSTQLSSFGFVIIPSFFSQK